MVYFDKHMALGVVEDALTNLDTPENRGMATGLCGAFYMCGLLNRSEWKSLVNRIPAISPGDSECRDSGENCGHAQHLAIAANMPLALTGGKT